MKNLNFRLRDIHIDAENIFEDIKTNKSSFIYKTIFYLLFFISMISYLVHSFKFGYGFGTIFLVLLLAYFLYFIFNIKAALRENIKSPKADKIDPESPEFLKARIQYISEGIKVTATRIMLVRNFYIIFFPLTTFILIYILRGDTETKSLVITFVISIILGGIFWYYYFKSDLNEIESDMEELSDLDDKINELVSKS